jgi:hypothetical protein
VLPRSFRNEPAVTLVQLRMELRKNTLNSHPVRFATSVIVMLTLMSCPVRPVELEGKTWTVVGLP